MILMYGIMVRIILSTLLGKRVGYLKPNVVKMTLDSY